MENISKETSFIIHHANIIPFLNYYDFVRWGCISVSMHQILTKEHSWDLVNPESGLVVKFNSVSMHELLTKEHSWDLVNLESGLPDKFNSIDSKISNYGMKSIRSIQFGWVCYKNIMQINLEKLKYADKLQEISFDGPYDVDDDAVKLLLNSLSPKLKCLIIKCDFYFNYVLNFDMIKGLKLNNSSFMDNDFSKSPNVNIVALQIKNYAYNINYIISLKFLHLSRNCFAYGGDYYLPPSLKMLIIECDDFRIPIIWKDNLELEHIRYSTDNTFSLQYPNQLALKCPKLKTIEVKCGPVNYKIQINRASSNQNLIFQEEIVEKWDKTSEEWFHYYLNQECSSSISC